MFKKGIILFLITLFMLSACHQPVYNQTMTNIAHNKLRAAGARKMSDHSVVPCPPLIVKRGPYVDTTPISLARNPSWMNAYVVIRGDQLPFSYYSRTVASGAHSNVLTKYQVGLDPAVTVSMNYSGSLKGALDLLAAKSGFVYRTRGNTIYWQAFITRTYEIAFMPGTSDYLMGNKSGGGGSTANQSTGGSVQNFVASDSSEDMYSNLTGKLSIWADVEATIKQLLSPDGKVTVSQATTSVTVRDRPTNVELIGQYIYNVNHSLQRQVLVKVQVIEVNLRNDFTWGIDWNLVINAFNHSPFTVNANFGNPIIITPLFASGSPNGLPAFGTNNAVAKAGEVNVPPFYTILLNALNQQGHASVVTEPRVLCMNNQVSVIRIVTQNGYVASIQNTTLAGGTTGNNNTVTSQITPGNLITGLTLYILPKILRDKIFLQINADLSTNDGFTNVQSGTANLIINLPNITEKHFNQRSMIHSGETLVLSGFRQTANTANAAQFLTSQALGGKGSTQTNKETIVLITPTILDGSVACCNNGRA